MSEEVGLRSLTRRLVEEYSDLIFRVSYTYLGSKADVEDICQEVLIKLIRRQEPFEGPEHERNWVIRVAINACKDLLRRRAAHPIEALDSAPEPATPRDLVENSYEDDGQLEVLPLVMRLPLKYREVIYLYYFEEQTAREIAQELGCTEGAVSIRLSRARKRLRTMLEEARSGRAV